MRFERKWTKCTVHAIRDVAPAIREFVLRPEAIRSPRIMRPAATSASACRSTAGRRRAAIRWSATSAPMATGSRFGVRRDSHGGSRYMWSLKPGARIDVSSPASLFEIDWSRKSYCLIAGGIGITPIFGIASALMRRNAELVLHYAVRSRHDAAYLDELADLLGDRLIVHASDEGRRIDLDQTFGRLPPDAHGRRLRPDAPARRGTARLGLGRTPAGRFALRDLRLERPVADRTVPGPDRPIRPRDRGSRKQIDAGCAQRCRLRGDVGLPARRMRRLCDRRRCRRRRRSITATSSSAITRSRRTARSVPAYRAPSAPLP